MTVKIIVATILAIFLIILIISLLKKGKNENNPEIFQHKKSYRNCPICGTDLIRGETIHSHLYPGKPDGMMYIYGCPFCYKEHPHFKGGRDVERICPSCKEKIPVGGWVIARVFEKPEKTHVHVLGCTVCRRIK